MTMFRLTVNGESSEVDCDPATPLLYVLRNDLHLVAAKFGCGLGLCGACMVWYDGHPTPSCDLPVEYAAGHEIRTLEGLGTPADPHPVQTAFLKRQAAQCGYCVAGIIMSAAAHVRDTPKTDREQVASALNRHLCRCGTQTRMIQAVLDAAEAGES